MPSNPIPLFPKLFCIAEVARNSTVEKKIWEHSFFSTNFLVPDFSTSRPKCGPPSTVHGPFFSKIQKMVNFYGDGVHSGERERECVPHHDDGMWWVEFSRCDAIDASSSGAFAFVEKRSTAASEAQHFGSSDWFLSSKVCLKVSSLLEVR